MTLNVSVNYKFLSFIAFLNILVAASLGYASTRLSMQASVKDSFEIHKIVFTGNQSFDDETLKDLITSKETPGGVSKFLYKIYQKLGSAPEYFDEERASADIKLLENYYRDQGFYGVRVAVVRSEERRVGKECRL